jgi:hypothetical protein
MVMLDLFKRIEGIPIMRSLMLRDSATSEEIPHPRQ